MSTSNELISIDEQALANIMNKRHKLARAQFKNPPQPKFCIREKTMDGQECFINVLSYSRIANKLSEYDPIPLYGGMKIRSFSSIKSPLQIQQQQQQQQVPLNPQLIFAVMASPEVLKKSGRNQMDNPEQLSLVELMCEFVEAMNPGIVLSKKPEVLRDRDLAGELKDVWSAVQNFRDRERAAVNDIVVYTEFGPESTSIETKSPEQQQQHEQQAKFDENNMKIESNDEVDNVVDNGNQQQQYNKMTNEVDESKLTTTQIVEQEKQKSDSNLLSTTKMNTNNSSASVDSSPPPPSTMQADVPPPKIEIEKLSISSSDAKKTSSTKPSNENHHHESNEKIVVKLQNQKNKESFLPKFLTSNKDKDKDKEKDKEKEKDETEHKVKTKKSLIFFRRSKSTTSSPTHAPPTAAEKNEDDN